MIGTLDPNMTWPCPRCKVPQVVTAMFCANCAQPLGAAPAGPPVVVPLAATSVDTGRPTVAGLRYPGIALGGVLVIVGSFLPWASLSTGLGTFTRNGIDGDGVFTLIAGVVLVFLAIAANRRTAQVVGILASIVVLFIVIHDGSAIASIDRSAIGTGFFAAGIGSLVAAIGSLEGR